MIPLTEEQQKIIEDSIWVVNTALKKQGLSYNEDLRQSALLYLCNCIKRFDPSMNTMWTTFAYKNIYFYIKRLRAKEKEKECMVFAKEIEEMENYFEYNNINENGDNKLKLLKIKTFCNDDEKEIINLKLKGYNGKEIANIMGCSVLKVNVCMKKIKEKAKNSEIINEY